jgi:anti-sigma B factor antagonist
MTSPVRYEQNRLHVDAEMTVYTCGGLKPHLLEQLIAHPNAIGIDLSRVVEFDTAGLQLLLLARRHATAGGRDLRVINPSRAVSDVLELCRLDTWIACADAAAGVV